MKPLRAGGSPPGCMCFCTPSATAACAIRSKEVLWTSVAQRPNGEWYEREMFFLLYLVTVMVVVVVVVRWVWVVLPIVPIPDPAGALRFAVTAAA